MSLERARIIKGPAPADAITAAPPSTTSVLATRARRISAEILDARTEAARIVAEAQERAAGVVAEAAARAATEAQEKEVARFAASYLLLRNEEQKQTETNLDRLIELAVILAERVIGEAIRVEPTRIAELAATAIQEARGARHVRIEACPDDVPALIEALGAIGQTADVEPDASLQRGSLIVHTDIGRVDARLEPQLTRLAAALREALK